MSRPSKIVESTICFVKSACVSHPPTYPFNNRNHFITSTQWHCPYAHVLCGKGARVNDKNQVHPTSLDISPGLSGEARGVVVEELGLLSDCEWLAE